jgi:hypothetical protein
VASVYKTAGYDAAKAVDISDLAFAMETAVRAAAAGHVLTANYMSGIHTERDRVNGVTHHVVLVEDENVYAVEWGHWAIGPGGVLLSETRVPGQFIITGAFRAMTGG